MKGIYNLFLLTFLFCVGAQAQPPTQVPSIKQFLSKIPRDDYEALDCLFRYLVFDSYFAYTLFGSKPMTHKGAFLDILNDETKKNEGDFLFLTHWQLWKKYASRPELQMTNFVFVEKQFPELFEVHFLNRTNVLSCVQKHLKVFQEVLGLDITPEKVYHALVHSDDVFDALGKSQILYGILFGFGEKNSKGFHDKFILEMSSPDPTSFNDEEPKPNRLTLPYFQTFSDQERKELKAEYQSERKHILSLYSKGNFLEITLTRVTSQS